MTKSIGLEKSTSRGSARLAVMLAVVAALAASVTSADEFKILQNGEPAARLAFPNGDAAVVFAADEYVAFLNALTRRTDFDGRRGGSLLTLAIAGEGSCQQADALMAANGLSQKTLGDEGFLFCRVGPKAYMLCAYSGKGVLNGVYKLMEKSFGVVAPRPMANLDFPDRFGDCTPVKLPYVDKPAFRRRGLGFSCQRRAHPDDAMWRWMARACLNSRGLGVTEYKQTAWGQRRYGLICATGGHSFNRWLPLSEYGKTHPEYYSLIGGKRVLRASASQISLGNPEVIDLVVKKMLDYKRKNPDMMMIPFGYNDSGPSNTGNQFGWSEDPRDCAMDSPEDMPKPGSKRPRSYSTRYIKACNQIIARLNTVYPDLRMMVYAYHYSMMQPPHCEIHPNLVIEFAPLYKCCHHPINDPNCPRNALFNEYIAAWAKRSPNVYMRDYFSSQARHFPLMTLHNLCSEMKYYRDIGLMGFQPEAFADGPNGGNIQGCYTAATLMTDRAYEDFWSSNGLSIFALARLGWNPDESMEDIVELYCRSYYGKAAGPAVAKYLMMMEENVHLSSHPGETCPDPLNGDHINTGRWCFCWSWNPQLTVWTDRLFRVGAGEPPQKVILPILTAFYDAERKVWASGSRLAINRFDADVERMERYLYAQGLEINRFGLWRRKAGEPPRFSTVRPRVKAK